MFKVLFIDDEQIVRQGVQQLIDWREEGFAICGEAADGNEGLQKILVYQPNLVLIDIKMPGMTGIEVIRAAREKGFEGEFIILTGFSDFEFAKQAIALKVTRYLLKPIDEDELIEIVQEIKAQLDEQKKAQDREENRLDYIHEYLKSGKENKKMLEQIQIANLEGIQNEVKRFIAYMEERELKLSEAKECVLIYWNQLCDELDRTSKEKGTKAQETDVKKEQSWKMDALEHVKKQETKEELYQWLREECCRVGEYYATEENVSIAYRMLNYIQYHYEQDLNLESLADLFHYNRAYLGKIFREEHGDYFGNVLDKIRIEKAKELLATTDEKIYKIAEQVGYNNIDYFYRKFKKHVGLGAKEYRKSVEQNK